MQRDVGDPESLSLSGVLGFTVSCVPFQISASQSCHASPCSRAFYSDWQEELYES